MPWAEMSIVEVPALATVNVKVASAATGSASQLTAAAGMAGESDAVLPR